MISGILVGNHYSFHTSFKREITKICHQRAYSRGRAGGLTLQLNRHDLMIVRE